MHTQFDIFRADLDALNASWQPKLDEIWKEIKMVSDKDLRLALIIEYNRFRDLSHEMDWLRNDNESLTRTAASIGTIRCQLHSQREHESVGDDVMLLVEDIEKMIDEGKPKWGRINAYVKRVIWSLKNGDEVIPLKLRKEIINRTNCYIVRLNENLMFPKHGIILQLRKDNEFGFGTAVAVIYKVECCKCHHVMEVVGKSGCDVYAPVKCKACKSYDIRLISTPPYDRMTETNVGSTSKCVVQ